jgi:hypothetical protein
MKRAMVNPEVINYIVQSAQQGMSVVDIKKNLLKQGGWSEEEVYEGLRLVGIDRIEALHPITEQTSSPLPPKPPFDVRAFLKKLSFWVGGLLFVAVLVWAGYWIYNFYFRSARASFNAFLSHISEIRSFEFDVKAQGEFTYAINDGAGQNFGSTSSPVPSGIRGKDVGNVTLVANGAVDIGDILLPKIATRVSCEAVSSSHGAGKKLTGGLEIRIVDGVGYVTFERLPEIPFLQGLGTSWVRISERDAEERGINDGEYQEKLADSKVGITAFWNIL